MSTIGIAGAGHTGAPQIYLIAALLQWLSNHLACEVDAPTRSRAGEAREPALGGLSKPGQHGLTQGHQGLTCGSQGTAASHGEATLIPPLTASAGTRIGHHGNVTVTSCPEVAHVALSADQAHHRARLAAISRHRPLDDATDVRGELKTANVEAYIQRVLSEAPPLTESQRARLAALLLPARRGGAAE